MASPSQKVNKPRKLEIMRNKKKGMLREIAAFGLVKLGFVALSFSFFLCLLLSRHRRLGGGAHQKNRVFFRGQWTSGPGKGSVEIAGMAALQVVNFC